MKYKKYYNQEDLFNLDGNLKEEVLDEIISVAYGDSGFLRRRAIYNLAKIHPDIKKVLNDYKKIAIEVNSIKNEEVPAVLVEEMNLRIGNPNVNERSFWFELYTVFHTKPVITGFATTALIILLVFGIFVEREPVAPIYSDSEIELADKQAREALAIVSSIFTKTKKSIENEILKKRVSKPINRSVNKLNDLFHEGESNEKVN